MILNLKNDIDIRKAKDRLEWLIKHEKKIELKEIKGRRSLSQNSYLHLLIAYYATEQGHTLKDAKLYYKSLSKDIYIDEKFDMFYIKSSSDLTTLEMTITIDRFKEEAKEQGVTLPDADEKEFLEHCQNQIDQNQYYLR